MSTVKNLRQGLRFGPLFFRFPDPEGLQSAELEQAVEAHQGVKYLSSMEMGELVGMKDRIKAFQMAFRKSQGN